MNRHEIKDVIIRTRKHISFRTGYSPHRKLDTTSTKLHYTFHVFEVIECRSMQMWWRFWNALHESLMPLRTS